MATNNCGIVDARPRQNRPRNNNGEAARDHGTSSRTTRSSSLARACRAFTRSSGWPISGWTRLCWMPPPTSVEPGTGTAIRARASIRRATPTAIPSRRSCSTSGTGRSASRRQPENLRYLNYVADKFDLRKYMRFNCKVEAARFDEAQASVAAQARRWPRADLPVRHSRGRAAVDADAAAAGRHGRLSRGARSTRSIGRMSRSNWPARRSPSSAPVRPPFR